MYNKEQEAQMAYDAAIAAISGLAEQMETAYKAKDAAWIALVRAKPFSPAEMERVAAGVKEGGRIYTRHGDSKAWGVAWNALRDRGFLTDHETVYKNEHLGWHKRSVDYGAATLVPEAIEKWREEGGQP